MLHHVVFLDDGRPARRPAGVRRRHGQPFYGTGEEHEQLRLPPGYGYPLHRRDRWRMQVMLMSHTVRPARVYVRVDDADPDRPPAHAGHPVLDPPERLRGELHRPRRRPARQHRPPHGDLAGPADGRIVAAGGHLHAGAKDLASATLAATAAPRRPPALRSPRRPGLRGAPGPPRARADRDPLLPLADRHPGPPGPAPADHRALRRRAPARAGHVDPAPLPRAAAGPRGPPLRAAAARPPGAAARDDGRTDPPYEPVPFNVMDDQGGIEQVDDLPGLPAPLGARGTVDLVGNRFVPSQGRDPARRASCAGASATPRSTTSSSPTAPPSSARPPAARGTTSARFRRPGTYGSTAPCTRSRCTRRSSSAERPMSSRDTPRPDDMTTETTTRGGAQAARPQTDPRRALPLGRARRAVRRRCS